VLDKTGLTRSTLYRRIQAGLFPPPKKDGSASVWPEHEVDAYIDRIAQGEG
jgi:predicted DNA-binding transcriptional regulator AlpA